jgi:hypothetical protein
LRRIAGDIRVVPAPEQCAGLARNAGVAAARDDVLAFIDFGLHGRGRLACRRPRGAGALRLCGRSGKVVTGPSGHANVTPAEAYEAIFAFKFKKYIEKDRFLAPAISSCRARCNAVLQGACR